MSGRVGAGAMAFEAGLAWEDAEARHVDRVRLADSALRADRRQPQPPPAACGDAARGVGAEL